MPRVTEVLDYSMEPELFNWHIRLGKAACKKIGDEAKRVGTLVDSLIQQDIRDGGYLAPEGDEPVTNCLRAWELFKTAYPEFVPSVVGMQDEVKLDDLVGHPDFIHADGITDLKCSSGIRPRYWTQTAQYLKMLGRGEWIAVLRLDKVTGIYEYKKITDVEYIRYEWKVFDAYLTGFNHNQINREKIRQILELELLGG